MRFFGLHGTVTIAWAHIAIATGTSYFERSLMYVYIYRCKLLVGLFSIKYPYICFHLGS